MDSDTVIEKFEKQFGEIYHVPYVLAVNSGSAALMAAILALGISRKKTIIVPAYCWPQIASVPSTLGYTIRYVDIDSDGKISIPHLIKAMGASVGAILVCHLFGNPVSVSAIQDIADDASIPLIEDCSQALFAADRGRFVGKWGTFGFCSTGRNKPLSTGEGGLLWTNSPRLFAQAYSLTQHNERKAPSWLQVRTLFSSISLRMHPCAAEKGVRQLKRLREKLCERSAQHERIRAILRDHNEFKLPRVALHSKAMWYHCPVLLERRQREVFSPFLWKHCASYALCPTDDFPQAKWFSNKACFFDVPHVQEKELLRVIKNSCMPPIGQTCS